MHDEQIAHVWVTHLAHLGTRRPSFRGCSVSCSAGGLDEFEAAGEVMCGDALGGVVFEGEREVLREGKGVRD